MEKKIKPRKKSKVVSADSLCDVIIKAIQDKKGNNIICMDLRHINEAMSDYFIVCDGASTTQTRAIIDNVEEEVKKQLLMKPFHLEGRSNGEWCLLDFGEVIVHVFQTEKREFYQLEDLWSDAHSQHFDE
ncbi:MAG TPA: ribosome silencing factor [Chitinophagales bacterium]|nr:ribosome silencing factor [Chitinophagales bacterium]HNM32788.1 ribosome silencing factor [Chitinophagales bacterium]